MCQCVNRVRQNKMNLYFVSTCGKIYLCRNERNCFSFSNQTTQCKLILSKFQEIISQITVFVIEIYFPLRSNLQSVYVVATAFSPHQLSLWMSVSFRMPGHICHMAAIFVYIFPASMSWFSLCQIGWTVFMNENHECVPWRTASADHTIFK